MRKLSFLFLVAMAGFISTTVVAQKNKQDVKVVKEVQQDMEEVKLSDLPDAVKKTLSETFAAYTAEKALKATKDGSVIYYIKLQKDGEYATVMIDEEGKVIEPEGK